MGVTGLVTGPANALLPSAVYVTPPINTAVWTFGGTTYPAPDPMGLSYNTTSGKLLVTDSEIEEFSHPYFKNVTFWETSPAGAISGTFNLATKNANESANSFGFTDEPADVAYNPADNGHYYFIDDNSDRVYEIRLGADGIFGTGDDVRLPSFTTRKMTGDPEGLGYGVVNGEPTLFIAAGEGPPSGGLLDPASTVREIFLLTRGPNGVFDGPPTGPNDPLNTQQAGDDIMTHFDTEILNQFDPEDVAYYHLPGDAEGHVFFASRHGSGGTISVEEATIAGVHVRDWPLKNNLGQDLPTFRPSGIAVAPSSNVNALSIYVADRGVDNDGQPDENDGEVHEWRITDVLNHFPVVTNPGNRSNEEGRTITPLQITATDPDNDPIHFSATNLPPGLSIDTGTGLISGTIPYRAWPPNVNQTVSNVTVTATDTNNYSGSAAFSWTVLRDMTAPATPGALTAVRHTSGVSLDWPDNTDPDLAGYVISRSPTGAAGTFTALNTSPTMASTFFDTTAPPNAWSYYQVTAVDRAIPGNVSPPRARSVHRGKIHLVGSAKASGTGMSLAIPRPTAALVPGDVLIAGVAVEDSAAIVAPQGWTIVSIVSRTVSMSHQAIYSHTVGASEPASYTFTFLGRAAGVGTIVAYRGAVERPSKVAAQANPASTSITAPSVTPALAESVQVAFFGISTDALITPPAALMAQQLAQVSGAIAAALEVADTVVDATAIGTRVATASAAAPSVGHVIILDPAP